MDWIRDLATLPTWKDVSADIPALRGEAKSAPVDEEGKTAGGVAATVPASPKSLCDLFALHPLPVVASENPAEQCLALWLIASQTSCGRAGSRVEIRVTPLQDSGPKDEEATASREPPPGGSASVPGVTLQVEVPGYDLAEGRLFRQLLLCTSGRALLLLAPDCCAVVPVPEDLTHAALAKPASKAAEPEVLEVRAVPLAPAADSHFVKVLWHPFSDAHLGVLLTDGTWQLLNLSRHAALEDPEVLLSVTFGEESESGELAADFCFGSPWLQGGLGAACAEAAWLALAVVFLSSRGRLSVFSPVLPCITVFPSELLRHLDEGDSRVCSHSRDWLQKTILASENRQELSLPGSSDGGSSYVSIRHELHLHGSAEAYKRLWSPTEQVPVEERAEGDLSPRSPRHNRSSYCSLQLLAHSPAMLAARATESGLVEVLALSKELRPRFGRGRAAEGSALLCEVFEEIDLVLGQGVAPTLRLSLAPALEKHPGGPLLLARTRSLLAAIELPWVQALAKEEEPGSVNQDGLPSAAVTTLMEVRAADGPSEIAGWQLLAKGPSPSLLPPQAAVAAEDCASLWLRVRETPPSGGNDGCAVPQALDVHAVLKVAAKGRSSKPPTDTSAGNARGEGRMSSGGGRGGKHPETPPPSRSAASPGLTAGPARALASGRQTASLGTSWLGGGKTELADNGEGKGPPVSSLFASPGFLGGDAKDEVNNSSAAPLTTSASLGAVSKSAGKPTRRQQRAAAAPVMSGGGVAAPATSGGGVATAPPETSSVK